MIETFREFTFEAAHKTPPYSGLHGHSFLVRIFLRGEPHPEYGWTHNQYEVEPVVDAVRRDLDQRYLNDVPGLAVPSLENVARWVYERFAALLPGLHRVTIQRGMPGQIEGCTYAPLGFPETELAQTTIAQANPVQAKPAQDILA